MKTSKRKLIWILILIPYLRPDCINGSLLSTIWSFTQILSTLVGGVFIVCHIRNIDRITKTTWMLVTYYLIQIFSDAINGLDINRDIVMFVKMSVFLVSVCFIIRKYKIAFLEFIYNIFKVIIILNGITVLFYYDKGIIQDAYNTPIYFWSTRNHIISLALVTLVLGYILNEVGLEKDSRYKFLVFYTTIEIFILKSSTAIIAITCFLLFLIINNIFSYINKTINLKITILSGLVLQILVVVFRIQEKFPGVISLFFNKEITLTGRTSLWDQALLSISRYWVWGQGNSSAAGLSGWLTMSSWNSAINALENTYFVAHNQILEILLNGGLMMLIPFLLAIFFAIKEVNKIKDNHIINMIAGTLFSYFIVMITEVVYPYPPVWIFIIMISCLGNLKESEKECYE